MGDLKKKMGMKINIKIINMEKNYYIKFLNYYEKEIDEKKY